MRYTRLLLSAGVAAALAAPAAAETATTTLDVTVSLQPALTVSCTDADFGIVRVRPSAQNNITNIEFSDQNTLAIQFDGGGVSLSGSPSASVCTVSGSSAADGAILTLSFDDNGFAGAATDGPTAAAELEVHTATFPQTTVSGGSATFDFRPGLRIPNGIVNDNFGDYVGSVTVTVDDSVGG